MSSTIQAFLKPHQHDVGNLMVRRVLPALAARTVGPFIFFDHIGPATLVPGVGLDVRPHPHIGLATVTYLFEGAIMHRDSVGSVQKISPGDVNWMTAGGASCIPNARPTKNAPPARPCTASRRGSRCPVEPKRVRALVRASSGRDACRRSNAMA